MDNPIKAGDWLTVAEADYCYGIGELTLEVTAVGDVVADSGDKWLRLRGRTIYWNGTVGEDRVVAVRTSVLAEAREKGMRRMV
jgi:hypothetical protein